MEIILASQSPRRRELLKKICADFRVIPSRVEEEKFRDGDPLQFALEAAKAKARDVGVKHPNSVTVAADTLVCLGNEVFGKPKDYAEARETLEKLSGKKHRVITAVALFYKDESRLLSDFEITYVQFKKLTPEDIAAYLEKGEYGDKAGSYAIQEVGDAFIERLQGDYDNVVGLPVKRVRKMLDSVMSPEHVVSVTDMALPNNWGVAKIGQIVTFIPGAVVGDKVRLKIAKKKRRHCFGRILTVEEPSPYRVEPKCPHFGGCGGCAFQNLGYGKQLELKERYLWQTLERIGRIPTDGLEKETIVPSPAIFFYRNKMEYAFSGESGSVSLGLRERSSPLEAYAKRTFKLRKCLIFSPAVEKIFPVFLDFAGTTGLPAFDPQTQRGFWRNLVLREAKKSGEILAVLVTKGVEKPEWSGLIDKLKEQSPEVKSLWRAENDRISDVVDFERKELLFGPGFIEEELGGMRFGISSQSFFQPNPGAAEILYDRILREAELLKCRKILGLYCGTGSIEIFLSRAADEVAGIDSEAPNIRLAEENCRRNGISNCRFLEGRVEDVLREQAFCNFDLLVVDPPRAGISGKGLKLIKALNVPRIIYVSCNPAALARDLSWLSENGYCVQKLASFDFFPHTPHLESLAVLSKK